MRSRVTNLALALSLGSTLVLGQGLLVGCAAGPGDAQTGSTEVSADAAASGDEAETVANENESASDETAAAETGDATATEAGTTEAGASQSVEVGSFTFTIPAYWAGRVECYTENDGAGTEKATVYLSGNADAKLAELSLVEGEEPFSAGDIGCHMVGSVVDGQGNHVEVWTYNWPWLAANDAAGSMGVDDAQLAELVDLSTGGLLSLEGLANEDDETINGAEYGFSAAELVPTVSFG